MDTTNELHTAESGFLPFDLIVVIQDVLKRWLLIVLAAAVVGVGSYILGDVRYEPVYQANATLVVTTRGNSTTVFSNLSSAGSLAEVFTDLLNSSLMRKAILEETGLPHLDGTISASVIPETNLMTLSVTASDPRTAFLVAQAIVERHDVVTAQVIGEVALDILQMPAVPMHPINSANAMGQLKRMAVLTALVSVAVFAWISFTRNAVRSGNEARKKLDCNYLGEIPHENKYKTLLSRLRRRKTSILITNPTTSFRYVETIRKLRRRVEQHMDDGKVVMVTSLLENEGKSTVAVNLALAMAKKHDRVLLIDCDLRKPACHAILDQKKFTAGIKEVLQGKAALSESIVRYKKTSLDILFGRKGDKNIGDLISSDRMDALLNWARENYDYVVLDLPPMAAASDAEGMTALADACILVVRQNVAAAPALNRAIASLEGQRAKLLGCVVNNVYTSRLSSGGSSYGGYHKYNYYGSYGSGK